VADADYERMRRLLDVVYTECLGTAIESESHPVRVLDAMFAARPAAARKGLRMAIGDIVEMLDATSPDYVDRLDARLREIGGMTLTEARSLFSRRLKQAIRRGKIGSEDEYYLVRNAAEDAARDEQQRLWGLIAEYESRVAK
jgi:hypothetical protein